MTAFHVTASWRRKKKLHLKWISCQRFWVKGLTEKIIKKENDHLSKIFFQLFLLHVWAEQKCTFLLKKDMTRIRCCSFRHQEFQARFLLLVHIILYLPALLLMPYWSRNLCQSWLIHSLRKSALFTVVHTSISNALTCPVSTTFCFTLWTINYESTSVQSQ